MNSVLTDCFLEIDSQATAGNTSVAISVSAESLEITAMGDLFRNRVGGLKDWGFSAEFNADAALATRLFDMVGEVVPIEVRPTSDERAVDNPAFVGSVLITECNPLDGGVGEVWSVSVTGEGSGPLTINTTPEAP